MQGEQSKSSGLVVSEKLDQIGCRYYHREGQADIEFLEISFSFLQAEDGLVCKVYAFALYIGLTFRK